jgi:hypothetical protein
MLDLFPPGERPTIVIAKNQKDFWKRFEDFSDSEAAVEAQGDAHERIDLRLVQRLEAFLVPILGQWENSDRWYHNLDCHGDAVRSMLFLQKDFDPRYIVEFHKYLEGEHAAFCVLCQIYEKLGGGDGARVGCVAICADRILVDQALAQRWAMPR